MERAIQILAVIHLLTVGLSHICAPRAWAQYFILLREKGHAGVLVVGAMSLAFGSLIVAFHPVWSGVPLVLTLLGWAQVLKGFIYSLYPPHGLRMLERVSLERAHLFIYPGVALVLVAALLGWHLHASAGG